MKQTTQLLMVTTIKIGLFDIDFVPKTSWHRSLACLSNGNIWFGHKRIILRNNIRLMFRKIWQRIRKRELFRSAFMCEICGSKERLHVHEVWSYDFRNKIQKLVGYKVLCSKCHRVYHSSYIIRQGDIEPIVDYILRVNNMREIQIARVTVIERLYKAYNIWKIRSNFMWAIDISMEKYLRPVFTIATTLLNYWILQYMKSNLDVLLLGKTSIEQPHRFVDIDKYIVSSTTSNTLNTL